ncbi:hypothetical protein OS493_038059 [Desmophyllum pertusum]|uniref:Uncharacterized protein n=1 Tax=Desmophyllum pertusum TaxID=174260 RepID=A0A9X0CGZ2_9CNID|nr:hypothetical protein OS493_038059 [Desmophyllum pertusum]
MLPVQFNSSYIQPQKLLKLSQWKVTVKVTIAKATPTLNAPLRMPRKPRNQERQRKTKAYKFTLDHTRLIQEGIDDETNSQWKKPVEDASEKAVGSNDLTSNAGDNNLAPVELDKLSVGQYVALDKAEWSNRPLIEHVENTAPIP